MRIRFYNAMILHTNGLAAECFFGELHTHGSLVSYVGEPCTGQSFDREIDCRGNLLIPGFKNAHAHSAMVFLRSRADDKPLSNWLYEDVLPRESRLNEDDIYELSRLAFMEYVSGGITSSFDMYLYKDAEVNAAVDTGFRLVLCGGVNDYGGTPESALKQYNKFNSYHPLVSAHLGVHAEYTSSLPLLSGMGELARELKAPTYMHNSETKAEVEACIARHACTPTELFDRLGLFDYGGGGFHCIHLSEHDLEIFKDRGLYAVSCCGSNAKLSSGIIDACAFWDRGIPLALGTDGAASNNALDFFHEMSLLSCLQKLRHGADAAPAERILHAACTVGADAMGLSDCNSLAVGKQADLVMIDLYMPNMQPVTRPAANLVYSGNKSNVALTMIAGKVVYERGSYYMGLDPDEIYRKANEIAKRIEKEAM